MVIGILAVGFQLNDVIASTAIKEYDVIRQITDLGAWFVHTKDSKAWSKAIKTQEMCKLLKVIFILMGNYSTF